MKYAGKDASEKFNPIHPPDTLKKYLPKAKHLGPVEGLESLKSAELAEQDSPEEVERKKKVENKPALSQIMNLYDFEYVARKTMPKPAWAYYSSGADDEISLRENHEAYQRIWFRPRVLIDVSKVDFSTTMLGTRTSVPFYITATALGKLGHPDGEVCLTKAADKEDVIQMIPTLASCSFDEIVDAATDKQTQWMQLYVNSDRAITKRIVEHAEKRGIKGLFITVDAPQLGRREKDMKTKFEDDGADVQAEDVVDRSQGAARAISSFIDTSLSWKDVAWFKSITKMPIILKGVQRSEDVLLAVEHGVQAVVLSNHGGRQLEYARSSIEVLAEAMTALKKRGWENRIEIFIDGGVRRATDILKAIALGAKGVGIGRPFLYAMSTYGELGVRRLIQILKDELEMNLRLLGVTSLDQLDSSFLDIHSVGAHAVRPRDSLMEAVYEPIEPPKFKGKL